MPKTSKLTPSKRAPRKTKVLIVEDEPMLQDAYRQVLTFKGYAVAVASNGVEGIEQLDKFKPQVVLLDVLMPRLDGIGFLQQSNVRARYPRIKIIACTNLSDQATADQMAAHGADRQVLKSDMSPTQLVELIEELVNEAQKTLK
jgi:CheY-like chemotaxis protein